VAAGDTSLDWVREQLQDARNHSGAVSDSARDAARTGALCAVGEALVDIAESLRAIAGRTP
jgi:hypothetical protein